MHYLLSHSLTCPYSIVEHHPQSFFLSLFFSVSFSTIPNDQFFPVCFVIRFVYAQDSSQALLIGDSSIFLVTLHLVDEWLLPVQVEFMFVCVCVWKMNNHLTLKL